MSEVHKGDSIFRWRMYILNQKLSVFNKRFVLT